MSGSTSEEKKNPVVTLKAQAEKFDFSKLRADEKNTLANSGETMFLDFYRMNFVVNKKIIDSTLIFALTKGAKKNGLEKAWDEHCKNEKAPDDKKTDQYKKKFEEFYNLGAKYTNLLSKGKAGNYRPFAKQVFIELFEYAKAEVPSDSILEELITSCNQLGYEGNLHFYVLIPAFDQSRLSPLTPTQKIVNISCKSPNCVELKSHMEVPVMDQGLVSSVKNDNHKEAIICNLQGLLEFTLESQDGKDDVTYTNGKLSLTIPRKLRDYKIDGRNLFDIIQEYFYKFCEKLGFKFEVEIEHNLGNPLEVNSRVKDPDVDPLVEHRPSVSD